MSNYLKSAKRPTSSKTLYFNAHGLRPGDPGYATIEAVVLWHHIENGALRGASPNAPLKNLPGSPDHRS